ncbi:hypothetical protein ACFPOE_17880 [Caenimonas terrae]|uniref:Uncharacterized protein n=1 Tax=Caenimonas terrae TaxID=696074 RepID=A0ABW0NH86_9BURK
MPCLLRSAGLLPLLALLACHAAARAGALPEQPAVENGEALAWLATAPAQQFRGRVAELARLYGESSGIDPKGLRITARRTGSDAQGCARVEVESSLRDGPLLRQDTVAACAH